MAAASVTEQDRTPYISDLLIDTLGGMREPETVEKAAENVLSTVDHGTRAIGELLWLASQNDEWFDASKFRDTVAGAADLVKLMGELSAWLRTMQSNAHHYAKASQAAGTV